MHMDENIVKAKFLCFMKRISASLMAMIKGPLKECPSLNTEKQKYSNGSNTQ